MICSLNEVTTTLRKAAAGSAFPPGLAEDIGAAGTWLCGRGYNGVGAVLEAVRSGYDARLAIEADDGARLTVGDANAGRAGPAALDLLTAGRRRSVTLMGLDSPLLVAGLAGSAAAAGSTPTVVFTVGGEPLGTITSTGFDFEIDRLASSPLTITVNQAAPTVEAVDAGLPTRVEVPTEEWAEATELAGRTYVPATEQSRLTGAGAGLSDND